MSVYLPMSNHSAKYCYNLFDERIRRYLPYLPVFFSKTTIFYYPPHMWPLFISTTNCLIFYTRLEELIKRIQSLAESLLLSGDSVVYDILKKGACYSFSYSSMFSGVHSVWNKLIWEYSPRHFLLRLFLCPVVEGLLWLYWLKMAIIFSFGFGNQKLMPGHQISNHF